MLNLSINNSKIDLLKDFNIYYLLIELQNKMNTIIFPGQNVFMNLVTYEPMQNGKTKKEGLRKKDLSIFYNGKRENSKFEKVLLTVKL